MFNIINHPTLPLFVHYGDNYDDTLVASVSCCSLDVHSFKIEAFIGINVCSHCGQLDAVFELFSSEREDNAGAIYTLINIKNVREFAGCKTAADCERVADGIVSGIKLAA
jgi:hypothetical protein